MIGCLWVLVFVVGLPLLFMVPPAGIFVLVGGIYGLVRLQRHLDAKRLAELTDRFGAENAVRIMNRQFWQGATQEMIVESQGKPVDIEERVLKTKTRHTFKYAEKRKGQFGLRVMFEDGICVGWEDKR